MDAGCEPQSHDLRRRNADCDREYAYTAHVKSETRNLITAFLHGFTGAGLFRRFNYPGAPTHFVDPRPVEEILASGKFDETLRIPRYRNRSVIG